MGSVSTSVQATKCTWPVAPLWSLHAMTDTTRCSRWIASHPLRRVASVLMAPSYSTQSMTCVLPPVIVLDRMENPNSLVTHGQVTATPVCVTKIP